MDLDHATVIRMGKKGVGVDGGKCRERQTGPQL